MTMPATDDLWALTEKEKQTLRLIVRGHDAKSSARNLGLSVHTINERLRDARRKMAVSSSREAARLLLEAERGDAGAPTPDFVGDMEIGEDAPQRQADENAGRARRPSSLIIGVSLMTLVLGLLALAALPQLVQTETPPAPAPAAADPAAQNPAVVDAARRFLVLIDQGRWDESYQATGASFRTSNTLKVWTDVSEHVRAPLGAVQSRTLISQENLPAPPNGLQLVKYRTRFAQGERVETVTLDKVDGVWLVVGVMIG